MRLRKLTVALGAEDQTRLIIVLLAALGDEFRRYRHELDTLLNQAMPDRADVVMLLERSHDLGEQADHLILAIARYDAAQPLRRHAEDLFDGFRSIEAAAEAALSERQWS